MKLNFLVFIFLCAHAKIYVVMNIASESPKIVYVFENELPEASFVFLVPSLRALIYSIIPCKDDEMEKY